MICEDERTTRCERQAFGIYLGGKQQPWFGSVEGRCLCVSLSKSHFLQFGLCVLWWWWWWYDCISTHLVPELGQISLSPALIRSYLSLRRTGSPSPTLPPFLITSNKALQRDHQNTRTHTHTHVKKSPNRETLWGITMAHQKVEKVLILYFSLRNKKENKVFSNLCAVRQTVFLQLFVAAKDKEESHTAAVPSFHFDCYLQGSPPQIIQK